LESQPSSRTGENPPYGMIGRIEETSASFEARSAPRSYPTSTSGLCVAAAETSPAHKAEVAVSAESFRRSREIWDTSPEEYPPEQSVFSDELVVERGKHVQSDEADKKHRKVAVCHEGRINVEGAR